MKPFKTFLKEGVSRGAKSVVVTFGRFNPPTVGHEKLVDTLIKAGKRFNAKPIIFASHSNDAKKNPLAFKDKVKFLKKAFPKVDVSTDTSLRNLFQVAGKLSDEGVTKFYLVVGDDRVGEFKKSLSKYIGATTGSLQLKFTDFEVVSAGARDPDADDITGMSASKMRALAAEGDFETFKKGLPKMLQKDAKSVWNAVKKGMGINESTEDDIEDEDDANEYDIDEKRMNHRARLKQRKYRRSAAGRRAVRKHTRKSRRKGYRPNRRRARIHRRAARISRRTNRR